MLTFCEISINLFLNPYLNFGVFQEFSQQDPLFTIYSLKYLGHFNFIGLWFRL